MQDEPNRDPIDKIRMVDVGEKPDTQREATAKGIVKMQPSTLAALQKGDLIKGDVLASAQIAGIMAAKNTPQIVPLCHPLLLSKVSVVFHLDEAKSEIEITSTVSTTGKTGVEMEALTAVVASALTIYDMCKSIDPSMRIEAVRLTKKSGGKSGTVELE